MTKRYMKNIIAALIFVAGMAATTACSDSYMEELNTDESKASSIEPSAQLTTALLQTYGDFGFMDTYRSYITGFTQHFAGGWNVSNYAGDVHPQDDQMRLVWDQFYAVSIKNIVDAIANSEEKPNMNAALRIHRVYLMSVLTDIYGDIPCAEAGLLKAFPILSTIRSRTSTISSSTNWLPAYSSLAPVTTTSVAM